MTSVVAVGVLTSSTVVAKPPKIKPPSTLIQKTSGPKPENPPELMLKTRDSETEEREERFVGEIITENQSDDSLYRNRVFSLGISLHDALKKQGIEYNTPQWLRAVNSFKSDLTPIEFELFKAMVILGSPMVLLPPCYRYSKGK